MYVIIKLYKTVLQHYIIFTVSVIRNSYSNLKVFSVKQISYYCSLIRKEMPHPHDHNAGISEGSNIERNSCANLQMQLK